MVEYITLYFSVFDCIHLWDGYHVTFNGNVHLLYLYLCLIF